jgi:hypothetical protein
MNDNQIPTLYMYLNSPKFKSGLSSVWLQNVNPFKQVKLLLCWYS